MRIVLIQVGKTEEDYIQKGISLYEKRIKHYVKFESLVIPALKNTRNLSRDQQKKLEAELILKNIPARSYVVLLDDKGKQFSSEGFSQFLQLKMNHSTINLVFIIGGPYGFDELVYKKANERISLSKMTFSHQMVRLIYMEQLYRAFTILKNEPYHH